MMRTILGSARRPALAVLTAIALAAPTLAGVNPQKMFALSSVNFRSPDGRTPKNTINFYDITDITGGGPNQFGGTPLFSIFLGLDYFGFDGSSVIMTEEDAGAITFNPVNGTIYAQSFNQITDPIGGTNPDYGQSRATNDTAGDNDFWRIDYQAILKDYTTNSRPLGTIYAPMFAPTTVASEQALQAAGDPRWDGLADGLLMNLDHEETATIDGSDVNNPPTVRLPNTIQKIGELGRAPTDRTGGSSFFNVQLEFLNPELFLQLDGSNNNSQAGDHQIRLARRVSTSPGMAVADTDGPDNILGSKADASDPNGFDDNQGGYNRGTVESWESHIIGRPLMDADRTDVTDWAVVKRSGTLGFWLAESDGANVGDDLSYFEVTLGPNPSITKKDLFQSGGPASQPNFLDVAENPNANPLSSDGEVDNLYVDAAGNLVFIESGFNDTPRAESNVFKALIGNYNGPDTDADSVSEVVPAGSGVGFNDPAAWTVSQSLSVVTGAIDDDADVTDTRFAAFDRGAGYLYIIDTDSTPANSEDLYVFDTNTGTVVYHEFQPFDPGILNKQTLQIMLRGDVNEDGVIDADDVDLYAAAMRDHTIGGLVSQAVGQEWYDLTSDWALTEADRDEFIRGILGTEYGDANLDGMVNAADLTALEAAFGTDGGWAGGDFNGDAIVDGADVLLFQRHLGFNNMNLAAVAVPEPAVGALALCGLAALARCRRR